MRKNDQDSPELISSNKSPQTALEKRRAYERRLRQLKENGFELVFNSDEFKARLALALEFSGKSRKQIEDEKKISSSMISTYLNTSIKPSLDTYLDLCDCLGVSPFWLMGSKPDADIEFGLNVAQNLPLQKISSINNLRSFQLAVMLAVHSRHSIETIYPLFRIIQGLSTRSEHQINLLQQVMNSMERTHPNNLNRYNSYLSDPKVESRTEFYDTLIGLNRITSNFYDHYISKSTTKEIEMLRHFAIESSTILSGNEIQALYQQQKENKEGISFNFEFNPIPPIDSSDSKITLNRPMNTTSNSIELKEYFFSKFRNTDDIDLFFNKLPEFFEWSENTRKGNLRENENEQSLKSIKRDSKTSIPAK